MSTSTISQTCPEHNPQIAFVPAADLTGSQLPGLIEVEGQIVHAPILEPTGKFIVDTGRAILELDPSEISVLRAVIAALDRYQEVA